MPAPLIAITYIVAIIVLILAVYSNTATSTEYRNWRATDSDMHRSTARTAIVVVSVLAFLLIVPMMWSFADDLSPTESTEEETSTTSTAPATTSTDTSDK